MKWDTYSQCGPHCMCIQCLCLLCVHNSYSDRELDQVILFCASQQKGVEKTLSCPLTCPSSWRWSSAEKWTPTKLSGDINKCEKVFILFLKAYSRSIEREQGLITMWLTLSCPARLRRIRRMDKSSRTDKGMRIQWEQEWTDFPGGIGLDGWRADYGWSRQ